MITVLKQVSVLFSFAALGYLLAKCKKVNNGHTPILSALLVNIFLPFNIFKTFSASFTRQYISTHYDIMIASAVVITVLAVIMTFASRLFDKRKYERGIYEYSLIIPNYGYMGYPMSEVVLGQTGLLNAMMFGFPVSFYTYTVGYCKLSKREISFKKLFNPVMVSMIAGALVGLSEIKIPEIATKVLTDASSCMAPVSMLLMGIVVSEFNFKELLSMKKVYIITLLRLIIIPIVIGFILKPFSQTAMQTAVILFAMPCGLNTIIFPRLVGEDCRIGAGLALVSNVLACFTIPLVLALFNIGG